MAHPLATHLLLSDLHAAMIADNALVADALIFSAMAFIVFHRAENLLAEKAVALRLVGAVVDGLMALISSGEARPIVILVKLLFFLLSLFKAICCFFSF
jgi:hypothetical protein